VRNVATGIYWIVTLTFRYYCSYHWYYDYCYWSCYNHIHYYTLLSFTITTTTTTHHIWKKRIAHMLKCFLNPVIPASALARSRWERNWNAHKECFSNSLIRPCVTSFLVANDNSPKQTLHSSALSPTVRCNVCCFHTSCSTKEFVQTVSLQHNQWWGSILFYWVESTCLYSAMDTHGTYNRGKSIPENKSNKHWQSIFIELFFVLF